MVVTPEQTAADALSIAETARRPEDAIYWRALGAAVTKALTLVARLGAEAATPLLLQKVDRHLSRADLHEFMGDERAESLHRGVAAGYHVVAAPVTA